MYQIQNDIARMRKEGLDLAPRWEEILSDVSKKLSFSPSSAEMRRSIWWKTGKVGAVSVHGKLNNSLPSVLKIQGTKPAISEFEAIKAFSLHNNSKIIRPPKIYGFIPWDKKYQFEAIVFEDVKGKYAIEQRPATDSEIDKFFSLVAEYRANCRNTPWIKKPSSWNYKQKINTWLSAVKTQAKEDKFKNDNDKKLAKLGMEIINKSGSNKHEFVHGHLAVNDLVINNKDEAILFSNLFWGWRSPLYDCVFAYHWWMLGMEHARDLTEKMWLKEQSRWLERMYNLPEIKGSKKNEHLLTLARLERVIPALMVDRFMMNQDRPEAGLITNLLRDELKRLIEELS